MSAIHVPAGIPSTYINRSYVPHSVTWFDVIGSRDEPQEEMMRKVLTLQWPKSSDNKLVTWSNEPIEEEDISSGNWKKILTQYVAGLMKAYEACTTWKLPPLTEETIMKTGTEEDVEFSRIGYLVNIDPSLGRSGEVLGDYELPPGIPLSHRRLLKEAEKTGWMPWRETANGQLRLWNTDEVVPEDANLMHQYKLWCYDEEVMRQILNR